MEEEFTNPPIDPNKALSFSAPLYLYYTKNAPSIDSANIEFNDFKFDQSCQNTATPFDSTSVSFADELFHSGVLLPLKPPPRLQSINYRSKSGSSSPIMSSLLKNPFARLSPSKNKDFDPFVVALEEIRKEEIIERGQESLPPRRSQSLSPIRNLNWIRRREEKLIETNPNSAINVGTSVIARKRMLKEKRRFVLKEMRKPLVPYKHGFLMCFGFGF